MTLVQCSVFFFWWGINEFNVTLCFLGDGSAIQAALVQLTGQRTVPNVFIAGQHIGGCDSEHSCTFIES